MDGAWFAHGVVDDSRDLLRLANPEGAAFLREVAERVIWRCIEANCTLSLRAADDVAGVFGMKEVTELLRGRKLLLKTTAFVQKGKWAIASQVLAI